MPLETGSFISALVSTNPVGATDLKSQGDDHLRFIKAKILETFPNITGAVTVTQAILNGAITAATLSATNGSSFISFLQAGTSATVRTVQAKLRDVISVKDFGAVGDGVADDTAAIQAAATYAASVNKSLFAPAGTYKITGSITLPLAIGDFYGEGIESTVFNYSGAGKAFILEDSTGAESHWATLRNFKINGTSAGTHGIYVSGAIAGKIDSVYVRGFSANGAFGVQLYTTSLTPVKVILSFTVTDCVIESNWHNLDIGGAVNGGDNNIRILNSKIRAAVGGNNFRGSNASFNWLISGNDFEASSVTPFVLGGAVAVTIENNYFETTTAAAAISITSSVKAVSISGNFISGATYANAIEVSGTLEGASIHHNYFSSIWTYAIKFTAGGTNVSMFNNYFAGACKALDPASAGFLTNFQYTNELHQNSFDSPVRSAVSQTTAVATGTTLIPYDDTIPQNTEGDQYMSVAYTPRSASSTLEVEVKCFLSSSVLTHLIAALFKDSDAGALAVGATYAQTATGLECIAFTYSMTSGTTSPITFKVRAGGDVAGTVTFNGSGGIRKFGGAVMSSIRVKEYLPVI